MKTIGPKHLAVALAVLAAACGPELADTNRNGAQNGSITNGGSGDEDTGGWSGRFARFDRCRCSSSPS